jgi:hypothetical protein
VSDYQPVAHITKKHICNGLIIKKELLEIVDKGLVWYQDMMYLYVYE